LPSTDIWYQIDIKNPHIHKFRFDILKRYPALPGSVAAKVVLVLQLCKIAN